MWETPGFKESVNNGEANAKEAVCGCLFKEDANLSLFPLPAAHVPQRGITAKMWIVEVCYDNHFKCLS